MKLSIIIPVLNERENIERNLPDLQWLRSLGHELILADGGSDDGSLGAAQRYADQIVSSPAGRSLQMNAGARVASGGVLLFLHVDTELPPHCVSALCQKVVDKAPVWGRFDVSLSGNHFLFRIIEGMMNWRSRITGIATGDQGIFVNKKLFLRCGGFAEISLMEDIEICSRLKRLVKPLYLSEKVITSSRRWEENGILTTVFLMWKLRLAYWKGVDPDILASQYYG